MIGKLAEASPEISDPRPQRHAARKAEIVAVAWRLARSDGFAGLSLRALAGEVGIRQPSLYAYFASKDALFDEMFAAGNRELLARVDALDLDGKPRAALGVLMHEFAAFCVEDPARAQLLFQRPIPGLRADGGVVRARATVPRPHPASCWRAPASKIPPTWTCSSRWSRASSTRSSATTPAATAGRAISIG